MTRVRKITFTLEELTLLLDEYGSLYKISKEIGYSRTSLRQQWLSLNCKCISCTNTLDKEGLICSKCLKNSNDNTSNSQPIKKECIKCFDIIERKHEQSNLSWGKKNTCDVCIKLTTVKCSNEHYKLNKKAKLERGKTQESKDYQKVYRKSKIGITKKTISNAKRRALKRTTASENINSYIETMLNNPEKVCRYCEHSDNLTIEHILPLSRGGTHSEDNVDLACKSCNSSKGSKTETEYMEFKKSMEN